MRRPKLEIADIFRAHGPAWRRANAGHVSLTQLKVMSAIEACRTEALGGHVAGCASCGHRHIAYNSCKNRHCPKCQGPAARDWMAARTADLLPVEYFHLVFTLPTEIAQIAWWNKKAVYDLLFRASAETVMTIAAAPKRLGARVGMTAVLHTWGSALTHHPHIHMIVPGGGLSPDGTRWVACRPGFLLHVQVLSRLFRRLFIEGLLDLHRSGHLVFFGDLARLTGIGTFATWLAPFRKSEWVVYAKPPFGVTWAPEPPPDFGRVRPCKETDYEAIAVHGSAEHRDVEGTGERVTDSGCLPQARDQLSDVLQIQSAVRRSGRVGGAAAEGARRRERQA